ncbi:type II secretion system F family protein [Sandarakinorhabdus sp.]|uniref:type II secretion system F family protein n=1 Tax=Sandarakinorhabdus sp. TaxID=1916663 RepID=UPI00286DF392|nr:type II secretion system F family protein [Sandarakinorhabdus sp.]
MAIFQYRAVTAGGARASGQLDAPSRHEAVARLRGQGISPIEIVAAPAVTAARSIGEPSQKARTAVTKMIGELAVLVGAGLSLDRALALAIENIEHAATRAEVVALLGDVREGRSLAQAMAARPGLFPPMAQAMVEAGEANGRLGEALQRLAETRDRAEALRQLIATAMIYPIALSILAVGVILLMLLFVVPQFESVFATAPGELPAASVAVMAASRFLREQGWLLLIALVLVGLGLRAALRTPSVKAVADRRLLRLPQIGALIVHGQTAQFARTLSVLVDGGVALPQAMAMAQRSLTNAHLSEAVGRVADSMKEGGGLSAPLAAAGVFPRLVLGFFRTGEETSQLGLMLGRLADVLDADVRLRIQRLIGWLVPALTIVMGAAVAGIIAAVMTAILGFNDLAVGQ